MEGKLFRDEAVRAFLLRDGKPIGIIGVPGWFLTSFLICLLVTAGIFVTAARYARKETVLGIVASDIGVERIAALKAGVVKKSLVSSGQTVVPGQPLFLLSFDTVLEHGEALSGRINQTTQAQLTSARQQNTFKLEQILQVRAEAEARRQAATEDLAQLGDQIALQQDRVALLEKDYLASTTLFDHQYISELQMMYKKDTLLQAKQSLSQLEQRQAQSASQIRQTDAQIRSSRLAEAEARAARELDDSRYDEKLITSQSASTAAVISQAGGRVTNVQAKVGDVVAPNQTLALVVPADTKSSQHIDLWVPSRAVGFVQTGTPVRLMFDAFPYQTFGVGNGRVVEVSTAPLMPNEISVPIETREQMYKIVVTLDRDELTAYGRNWKLMPGMRLTADLVLEERSFLDWLLDPLLAAKRRV